MDIQRVSDIISDIKTVSFKKECMGHKVSDVKVVSDIKSVSDIQRLYRS